jgi:hypothetical protein
MSAKLKRLRWPLLGAAAAALGLVTTTALAGSGVGGVFNLGVTNTVDAPTVLSGNPGANAQLRLMNKGTGAALRAESGNGVGINGSSATGTGQFGQSQTGIGLLGAHTSTTGTNPGVQGQTASTNPLAAGVVGRNTGGGPGLRAVVSADAPPRGDPGSLPAEPGAEAQQPGAGRPPSAARARRRAAEPLGTTRRRGDPRSGVASSIASSSSAREA